MNSYKFPFGTLKDKSFNAGRLIQEIKAAIPSLTSVMASRATYDARDLVIDVNRKLSDAEQATVKTVIQNHASDVSYLPAVKEAKFASIDMKTKKMIDAGFLYNGVRHSLSENMQKNLLGAMQMKDNPALYPIKFNSLDDHADTTVSDATALQAMFAAAMLAIRTAWDAGTALKDQVRAATAVEQVNAIKDAR